MTAGSNAALTRGRLAWRQATHRGGWALALWLSLAAAIALPALLLLLNAMAVESGLAETLSADGGFSVRQTVPDVDAFNALDRQVSARVAARTGDALVALGPTATTGPLHLVTVRSEQAPAALTQRTLTATYAAHLADHVAVVAGELPVEGLGGGETAVAMPRAGADQLGLGLSDRLCADFTAGPGAQARWCARIVGLWRPLAADDPFWNGEVPRLELTMGRFDLFELAKLHPPQAPVGSIRYWATPWAVGLGGASGLAGRVGELAADMRAPNRQVDSRLDRSLIAFTARQRTASAAIHALAALIAVLGLTAVALVVNRFLAMQSRELALLRARGWPRGRVWRVAFVGVGAVGMTAVAAAVAICAIAAAVLSATGSGVSVLSLQPSDLPGLLAAVAAIAVALVGLLALLAARAVWHEPRPSLRGPEGRGTTGGAAPAIALGAVGLAGMALPHLPGAAAALAAAGSEARDALLVAPALGAILIAAGAVMLRPPAVWIRGRGTVHGELAGFQLERRPGQHAGAAFLLMVASAGAVFAALAVTSGAAGAGQPGLRVGLDVAMAAGAIGGLVVALAGFGLHFRGAARRRVGEYGGLFAHGLPPAIVSRSLAAEQAATAGSALVGGCVLGAALALAVLPMPPAAAVLAGLAAVVGLGLCAAAIASISRRVPDRIDPLRLRGRA